MKYRPLGRTGWEVSEISFGAWAIGGSWGSVHDEDSRAALRQAIESGINFIDTADVYGDGRSEKLVSEAIREFPGRRIYVATKAGRRLRPHTAAGYNRKNLTSFVDRSLSHLKTEAIDLLQLHCPPPEIYDSPDVFGVLDDLQKEGKIRHYGVSVETVNEGLKAIRFPRVQSIQIIFNMFRHKPAGEFFDLCKTAGVGVLARVPLASGMLTGKFSVKTTFPNDDHRHFNRNGAAFDIGETFSGVPYEVGLQAVTELRGLLPEGTSVAQMALRWILMFDAVTCAIPGAKTARQAEDNARASSLPPLSQPLMLGVREIYDRQIRAHVHTRW